MSTVLPASVVVFLAQAQPPAPGADRGEEFGKTSPIALVVILLLGIATALLIRSMTKRLRNVPESFDPPGETERSGARPSTPEPEKERSEPDPDEPPDPPSGTEKVDSPSPGRRTDPEG
ncbi:hypothetical protein [Actinomycetospora termitidis]|uniref:Secreted protein n=1 Tax=Actinomycetospora termitidis TaxID=3053470 RepID=A0ABT7MC77_9PSEU|nr:hypothetical protein [Actinomycetospora sp. Odt1-22]MDL5157442.1 hypothetical protein [Actinomycetospora sp. Odt1-22]